MKANEAPERIWINSPQDLPCSSVDSNSIEYTRTDAFIDKAAEWFRSYWRDYVGIDKDNVIHFGLWENDFRHAMKGE